MIDHLISDYIGVSLLAILPGLLSLGIFLWVTLGIKPSTESRLLSAFVLSNSIWQLNEGLMRLTPDLELANRFHDVSVMGLIGTCAFGVHFILCFTQNYRVADSILFKLTNYVFNIFFIILLYLYSDFLQLERSETWNWIYITDHSLLQSLLVLLITTQGILMLVIAVFFAIKTRSFKGNLQKRAWLLFIGLGIPIIVGLIDEVIPYLAHTKEIPITSSSICFFSVAAAIALKKYNLLKYSPLHASSQIFRSISEGITITDAGGIIQYVNPQFANMAGYSVEELIGLPFRETLLDQYSLTDPTTHNQKHMDGSQQLEVKLKRKDGTYVDVLTFKNPFNNEKGMAQGQLCIHLDISMRKKAMQRLEEERKHSKQFQSMLLSSQINPHFIFNSLNAVQYHILDKEVEPALNYISEFSMLIRSVLENSMHHFISLKEEVDFIGLYLKLEKQRFRDRFSYEIVIEPGINPKELLIPPMLLQPYVENAIIHGIAGLEGRGKVSVCFESLDHSIICTIEDNGIGREQAMERKKLRTGANGINGMKKPEARLKLLNELENDSYTVTTNDLKDKEGTPIGTKVAITFPVKHD